MLSKQRLLYNGKFHIPWGSKLFVGIEDVSLSQMENSNSDALKLIIKILCDSRIGENDITLQTNSLVEMSNSIRIKQINGQTISIDSPWIYHQVVDNYSCSPDIVIIELSIQRSNVIESDINYNKNISTLNNDNGESIQSNGTSSFHIKYKFRLNYLIY